MANKPTKAEYEGFKKAVANPMTPPPIKQKLQSIIDQYASEYEGSIETSVAEPKKRAGRKPSTTNKYKTLPKPKMGMMVTATTQAVEEMKAQLKKLGYNPEEVDALNGNQAFAILEELKSKMVGKPKRTAKPKATKKTATDIEKAKAEIKAKTGKTEEECEAIIEQYRALRTKAQEGKRKAEQASATNKKRVAKLEDKGDLIEGTNVKTADAVIETTAQEVAEKIEQQIEAVEEKAEKEAKAEVAKDNTKKTPTQKKQAVESKVEKKVKEKTKVIVKKVVIDTSALLTSIAESLGKFDKDSQKEFLIKLRSDIDKLLSKYAFGGMTDGATQVMNIQQSNLSSSSVNPTMFAKGGSVDASSNCEKTYKDYRYSKGYSRGWEYDSKTKTTKKYIIDLIVDDESRHLYHETNDSREILGYVNALKKNAKNLYRNFDGIEVRDAVDGDYRRILVVDYNKGKWSDTKIFRDMNSLLLQDVLLSYGFKPERGDIDEEGVEFYDEIEDFRFTNKPFFAVVDNKEVEVYNADDEEVFNTNDATELDIYLNGFKRHYPNIKKYATGGVVGQEIVFDDNGEENTGVIDEITNLGDYVVRADDGRRVLASRELDVISLGGMRQVGVEQRKKRFGFFAKGGSIGSSAQLEYIDEAYASSTLQDALREKLGLDEDANSVGDNVVISFAYTDYGGDFLDKVAIAYFQENYPENTLVEYAGYNGENAFVFGEPAQEWIDSTEDYPLGFEDFEDFYYDKMNEAEYESFEYFIDDLDSDYSFDREEVMSWLMENKGGYYSITTQGLDFSYSDLTDELIEEGLISKEDDDDDEEYARGGGVEDVIVYDNGGETFDRYTIFTPDGSVYGMSDNALMPNGFNMYIGDKTEIKKGSHLGKKLKSVPESIKVAVERRMSEEYAHGGLTEHGLRVGDKITRDFRETFPKSNEIGVLDEDNVKRVVNLDRGTRMAKGGKLWIDTKGKGGLKGVKPSRKNTFRNEAVKRGLTSGQLASKVLASPSRYKGINPRSAQLVKNMGVRKHGGSIGDILRNRRGE